MQRDLARPHPFAGERVGFLFGSVLPAADDTQLVFPLDYEPLADSQYLRDYSVGARISGEAIRRAMQRVLNTGEACLHVHMHEHEGVPAFSRVDLDGLVGIARSLAATAPGAVHGGVVLSHDAAAVLAWDAGSASLVPAPVRIVGLRTRVLPLVDGSRWRGGPPQMATADSRQAFLGRDAEQSFARCNVGIVGLSGGGSHVAHQLAHVGFRNYSLFDPADLAGTDVNRVVGTGEADLTPARSKVWLAERAIRRVRRDVQVATFKSTWQEAAQALALCDVVFGCVDGLQQRDQLEAALRRYRVPYIDVGLDVRRAETGPPRMAGQVILSAPGSPCMRCLGFLDDAKLGREAARYGDAGPNAQVVWANGVLASTAVGIAIQLLTGWCDSPPPLYLSYDGNLGTVSPHVRLEFAPAECVHYPPSAAGAVRLQQL